MKVAPEGRPFIAIAMSILVGLLALAAWRRGWWLAPALLWAPTATWVPWFFRDPTRRGPHGERLILAPADGKVVSVAEVDEPAFVGGRARRVSVFMNVFDVHVNRHPADGTVRYRQYRPGAFFNASLDKASERNEQMSLGVQTNRGRVLVRQIAGLVARRIVTDPQIGDQVRQGERLGLIRFGSRVDTLVPMDTTLHVQVGQRTRAGLTVLGEWMP